MTGLTSFSWTHTNTAGNLLLLFISWTSGTGAISGAPTYNGVAMTQIPSSPVASGTSSVAVYYLKNPATGAKTLAFATAGAPADGIAGAFCFTQADLGTTFGTTATGSSTTTNPSITVTSAVGEIVVAAVMAQSRTISSFGASQTQLFLNNVTAPVGGGSFKSGAASVTMSATLSATGTWASIGVSVKPLLSIPNAQRFMQQAVKRASFY